jgi:hypothetical protein
MNAIARALVFALAAALVLAAPARAADIVLDGLFSDWAGQPNVGDPQGDARSNPTDLRTFYFADNPGVEAAYFMAERWQGSSQGMTLRLSVDTGNDGNYGGTGDRLVVIDYVPLLNGRVRVSLYDGTGRYLKTVAGNARWGEAGSQGRRVEWGVSFADLGIQPFQTIRLRLVSMQGIRVSDEIAEVQWSPANALGWPLLALLAAAGAGWLARRRRKLA